MNLFNVEVSKTGCLQLFIMMMIMNATLGPLTDIIQSRPVSDTLCEQITNEAIAAINLFQVNTYDANSTVAKHKTGLTFDGSKGQSGGRTSPNSEGS